MLSQKPLGGDMRYGGSIAVTTARKSCNLLVTSRYRADVCNNQVNIALLWSAELAGASVL
ncbi:MAG TPA: hypothetical protein VIR01_14420 [Pyrinomonadaceae bacterium]